MKTIQVYLNDRFIMVVQNVTEDYILTVMRTIKDSPYDYRFIVY